MFLLKALRLQLGCLRSSPKLELPLSCCTAKNTCPFQSCGKTIEINNFAQCKSFVVNVLKSKALKCSNYHYGWNF